MRCPDCNKFVAFEEVEPEVNSIEVNDKKVSVETRIVNCCADCSTELTDAEIKMEHDFSEDADAHEEKCKEASYEAREVGVERTSKSGYHNKKGEWVNAGGRYAKTFYGVSLDYEVVCEYCGEVVASGTLEDFEQASSMNELT